MKSFTKKIDLSFSAIKYITLLINLFFLLQISYSQKSNQEKIDSLKSQINSSVISIEQVDLLNAIAKKYLDIDYVQAEIYAREALKKSEKIFYKEGIADAYYHIGYAVYYTIDLETSLEFYHKALKVYKELNQKKNIVALMCDIAYINGDLGNTEKQIYYYREAESLAEKNKDSSHLGTIYNNLGIVFSNISDSEKTIYYYKKSIELQKILNNKKNLIIPNLNVGLQYFIDGDTALAKSYYKIGYDYAYEIDDLFGKIVANNRFGNYYFNSKKYDSAFVYYNEGASIASIASHKDGYANSLEGLARINYELGNYKIALKQLEEVVEIYDKLKKITGKNKAFYFLQQLYSKIADHKNAYYYLKMHHEINDSLYNEKLMDKVQEIEGKYQFEKKQLEIENLTIESENKKIIHQKTILELDHQKTQKKLFIFIIIFVIIISIISIVGFIQKRKSNIQINKQKEAVEKQKELIELQHHQLEQTHKEITDSIQYAKRIQAAILPPNKVVKSYLKDSFIIYRPKDIVAGDFYWMEHKNNKILFAAADCTGHGVPGAMVSVVCNNGLNRSVREHGLTSPSEILDKTREIVINEFEKSEEEVKDGMDISLCSLDISKLELEWAGANNPLWIIRNNEIIEYKGDKQPIGKYANAKPFTNHNIQLLKDDLIYIFTDGFIDQFGGDKGKKFLSANFKKLLISIQELSMNEQNQKIVEAFENWKNKEEQVDDVCIIGIRI